MAAISTKQAHAVTSMPDTTRAGGWGREERKPKNVGLGCSRLRGNRQWRPRQEENQRVGRASQRPHEQWFKYK